MNKTMLLPVKPITGMNKKMNAEKIRPGPWGGPKSRGWYLKMICWDEWPFVKSMASKGFFWQMPKMDRKELVVG
jgi:hypothetical protein